MIMKEYSDEELLMLSGIHHFAFCKRRWALVHLENQWADNVKTVIILKLLKLEWSQADVEKV